MINIQNAITQLTAKTVKTIDFVRYKPVGPKISVPLARAEEVKIPKKLNDLPQAVVRAYNLSVTMASELSIPVIGSVSGGYNRRVVVLERSAFKKIPHEDEKHHYGYAIRLCLTINKWETSLKTSLSFLAASAELGHIKAEWILHVMGLAGLKIDEAIIPPRELNVETFVLIQQSLSKLIKAKNDKSTKFIPTLLAIERPKDALEKVYKINVAKGYALSSLEKGWKLNKAIKELKTEDDEMIETIVEVYKVAGITDPVSKPGIETRNWANSILGKVLVSLRK